MTDIPLTTGQPDRGANAYQYTGLTIYDPLIAWELDISDRPGKMIPGLATEWKVGDSDKTLWTFKLRDGSEIPRRVGVRCRCGKSGTSIRSSTRRRRSSTRASPPRCGRACRAL